MPMIMLALTFWFLAHDSNKMDGIPTAFGPYPTREFCRIAAHQMMPHDELFWTDAQQAEAKARREREQADREAQIAVFLQTPSRNGWYLMRNGERVHIDPKTHEEDTWHYGNSSGYAVVHVGPDWVADAVCTEVDRPDGVR